MDEGYAVEPAELTAIVGHLGRAATALKDHQDPLATEPDAGRSSTEVAAAFALLSTALGGLSDDVSSTSSTLSTNVARYRDQEAHASRLVHDAATPR